MENIDLQIQGTDDLKDITAIFLSNTSLRMVEKRPKYVRELPYICILLSLIIVSRGSAVG